VFDEVRVFRNPDFIYVRSVTDAVLDELEALLGTRLPRSYREFVKRFGEGELEHWVMLHRAMPSNEDGISVASHTRDHRDFVSREAVYYPNAPFLLRLVYFASSGGGDTYAWDPVDVTCSEPHECQFYYLPRLGEVNPVLAGRSFAEFLQWAENHYRPLREGRAEAHTPGIHFKPWHLRIKEVARQNDINVWLAHNNRTARLIARSIRDRGQADAFPILADALQEAGCTNADLLDSCRTGDPDIDGVWVLRMLLGEG